MAPWTIARTTDDRDIDAAVAIEALSFPTPWSREMLARDLSNTGFSRLYVLRDEEVGVRAFCACWLLGEEMYINTLAVDPAVRRRGVATALLADVLRDAAGGGALRATLEVRRSNVPALRLYERFGFTVAAVRPKYYSQPEEDGLILWRYGLDELLAASPPP